MKKIDLQDVLLLLGVASIVGGVFAINRPAAAIVFGFMCLSGVRSIARASSPKGDKPEGKH